MRSTKAVGLPGVVTEEDYQLALKIITSEPATDTCEQLAPAFLLLLCYRFGLRSAEAIGLARTGWQGFGKLIVASVQNNTLRRLKVPTTRRQVPLLFLLSELENQIITQWLINVDALYGKDMSAGLFFKDRSEWNTSIIYQIKSKAILGIRSLRVINACILYSQMIYNKHSYDYTGTIMSSAVTKSVKFQKWRTSVASSNAGARIKLIRAGVDAHVLISASEYFDMPRAQFVKMLGMSPATAERKIKNRSLLGPAESERLERLAIIEDAAEKVFGSAEMAKKWMMRKNLALGDTPLSLLDTETGAGEVRKVLASIAYGGAV